MCVCQGEIAEDAMEGLYDNLKPVDTVDIYELLSDGEIQVRTIVSYYYVLVS